MLDILSKSWKWKISFIIQKFYHIWIPCIFHIHLFLHTSMNLIYWPIRKNDSHWSRLNYLCFKNICHQVKKLWLFSLLDELTKLNILSRRNLEWQTPYYLWYGLHYDFSISPLLTYKQNYLMLLFYIIMSAQTFHKAGTMFYIYAYIWWVFYLFFSIHMKIKSISDIITAFSMSAYFKRFGYDVYTRRAFWPRKITHECNGLSQSTGYQV